jgi:hypothetical protein
MNCGKCWYKDRDIGIGVQCRSVGKLGKGDNVVEVVVVNTKSSKLCVFFNYLCRGVNFCVYHNLRIIVASRMRSQDSLIFNSKVAIDTQKKYFHS